MQSGRPEYHYERQKALKSFSRFNQLTICFLAEKRISNITMYVYIGMTPLLAHCVFIFPVKGDAGDRDFSLREMGSRRQGE